MAGPVYYLYGIIKDIPLKDTIPGIDKKENVFAASCKGIAGIISRVNLDEFGEVPLKQNLESLDWVRENVFSHERVIEEVMRQTTVIPMKFCTIFTATERILELLREKYDYFSNLLERYGGRNEWGVKVYCSINSKPADKKAGSGREYLMKKKAEQEMELQNEAKVNASVENIFNRIRNLAEDSKINRPTPRELLVCKDKEQVLNVSFLVKDTDRDKLTALVEEMAEEHKECLSLELVGPLPVYSFIPVNTAKI